MTAFSLARVVAGLEDRQLVIRRSDVLPSAIEGVTDDSRRVLPGDLFVAVPGTGVDGHTFLPQAAAKGAVAAIVERPVETDLPVIVVRDARAAAGFAAATFYRHPARELRMAGVTGTNGKTTTVALLRHLLNRPEKRAASIGTLGVVVNGESAPPADGDAGSPSLTTPGAIDLQRTLRSLADRGVRSVAMEVSSHSLDQRRVDAIEFDVAVFTNLSRDHMDYHGTMEAYFEAKARLLDLVADDGVVVLNGDEPEWRKLPASGKRVIRYAVDDSGADVRATEVRYAPGGSSWKLGAGGVTHDVELPLIGAFNVSNALAAAAAAIALGLSPAAIAGSFASAPQVTGRMERILGEPVVLRDYAHTPDALERAITALKPFAPRGVLVVFGCGGDRDRGKRPEMGAIAARLADRIIITSDNPRTEDPEAILDEIAAGMPGADFERIEDRRAAIARAIDIASDSGETVLLAGKGHETYQIRGRERLHFDEKEVVAAITGGRVAG